MATRLKPTRINVDNTPRVGDGASYQNDNDFHWSMGGGDMSYRDFEWHTLTGNSITIEDISNNITPSSDFTVYSGTELKPGIEYVLRVNTGNTPYTMTLGTGVTNPNSYKTELKPNTVNQFKFIATSTNQLELEGVDSALVSEINWGEIGGTLADQTDLQDALDTKQDKLTAGEGIEIKNGPDYSAMQGPAPSGFHVPLNTEWQTVYDIWTALGGGSSDGTNFGIALKLPFAGLRNYSSSGVIGQGTFGNYWSSSRYNANYAYVLLLNSTALNPQSYSSRAYGYSVRCFKDSPTVPTSTWTKLYGTSIETGGIFWSSADGLISLSSDGQTWVTIADKNLGATQVWNSGDTVTASNCGDYYQWGNNYGFPFDGNVTTSSTQVDASNYGPGNYYSSSTFITYEGRWDTTDNGNLRGGVTGIVTLDNAITNTGVLSVNGQTGNVIINPPDLSNYLAKNNTTAFTPTGDYQPATKKYVDDNKTKLHAGEGISIEDVSVNGRKGPSPDGFHVPSTTEWQGLKTIMDGLSLTTGNNWKINLHMPFAGFRYPSDASLDSQGSYGYYWSSSPYSPGSSSFNARSLHLGSSNVHADDYNGRGNGYSVRCFKDSYVSPDLTWTVVQGVLGSAGIFWNQSDGLISITSDGTTGYTIMDKNLGATTVYNDGDTLSQANMGNMYQWGNNYGFPSTGTITNISSTQVDASSYGPTNPYSSNTFITTGSGDWSSVRNNDLWGDTTGTYIQENVISNTGVLSVNGQTGDVTIASPDMSNYLAKDNTTSFTPTGDYNPATKKYVDDQVSAATAGAVSDAAYNETTWDGVTGIAPSKNAVRDKIVTMDSAISGNTSDISTINGKIPSEASTSNQLADKQYVLNNINSVTAYYITKNAQGDQFATYAELAAATTFYSGGVVRVPTRNDYTIVLADENHDNATTRYIYNSGWEYQYTVNETALTQAQLDAINSGITAAKVTNYDALNTKTFYLSSTSDLTTAQDAYDWVRAGKMAIVKINTTIEYTTTTGTETVTGDFYFYPRKFHSTPSNEYDFAMAFSPFDDIGTSSVDGDSCQIERILKFTLSGNTVTNVTITSQQFGTFSYLSTRVDYPNPYQPTYAGSPATKKYVDDGLSGKQATLVSGTNIKTVNGNSLLGSGNLTISGGISLDASSPITVSKLRVGTEAQYSALATKSNDTIYMTV